MQKSNFTTKIICVITLTAVLSPQITWGGYEDISFCLRAQEADQANPEIVAGIAGAMGKTIEGYERVSIALRGMLHGRVEAIDGCLHWSINTYLEKKIETNQINRDRLEVLLQEAEKLYNDIIAALKKIKKDPLVLTKQQTEVLFRNWLVRLNNVEIAVNKLYPQDNHPTGFKAARKIFESKLRILGGISLKEQTSAVDFFEKCYEIGANAGIFGEYNKDFSKAPETVYIDSHLLKKVIVQLVENAAIAIVHLPKEVSKDDKEISIKAEQEGNFLIIKVSDEGTGIRKELLEDGNLSGRPKIFDLNVTTGGTGLGLCEAWWVIKDHGGTITVESEVGVGTTFTIRLPIVEPVTQEDKDLIKAVKDKLNINLLAAMPWTAKNP